MSVSSGAAYQRARTKRLRDCGLCFVCGQRPAWRPERACLECRDRRRAKDKARDRTGAQRERIKRLRASGTCYACGRRPARQPDSTCAACWDKKRDQKNTSNRLRAEGRATVKKEAELSEYTDTFTARRAEYQRTHPERRCCRCSRYFQPTASRTRTCGPCLRNDVAVSVKLRDRWAG